jgi:serine/threonine protein kinase
MDIRRYFKSEPSFEIVEPEAESSLQIPEPEKEKNIAFPPFTEDDLIKEKKLGAGAFGTVYLVKDKRDAKNYALKIYTVRDHKAGVKTGYSGSFIDTYGSNRQEIDFLQRSDHPNIVKGLGVYLTQHQMIISKKKVEINDLNLVMELADNSLRDYLKDNDVSNKERIDLCYHALCGVNFMHQNGYLHCDLKTDNMLILNGIAKLSDPGLMMNVNAVENIISADSFCNSILMRAPEFLAPNYLHNSALVGAIESMSEVRRDRSYDMIDRYYNMLLKTQFYHDLLDINETDEMEYVTVKSIQYGEIFSFGMLMLQIYISPIDIEDKIHTWIFILFYASTLPYKERLENIRKLPIWPKKEKNIPELDELLASLLEGNPDKRKFTFENILKNKVFENNGYTAFIKGTISNSVQNISLSCSNITEKLFLPTLSDMAYFASERNMFIYNLSKAYALFHKILQDLSELLIGLKPGITPEKINAAGAISIFFSIGRNDYMMQGVSLDIIYSFFYSRRDMLKLPMFMEMLKEIYTKYNGIDSYESTFDYGSTGNVDIMSLKYYTSCELIEKYNPSQYVVEVEKEYLETHKSEKVLKVLSKNSLVKESYDEIKKYFVK